MSAGTAARGAGANTTAQGSNSIMKYEVPRPTLICTQTNLGLSHGAPKTQTHDLAFLKIRPGYVVVIHRKAFPYKTFLFSPCEKVVENKNRAQKSVGIKIFRFSVS